jgi:hypothetical protein
MLTSRTRATSTAVRGPHLPELLTHGHRPLGRGGRSHRLGPSFGGSVGVLALVLVFGLPSGLPVAVASGALSHFHCSATFGSTPEALWIPDAAPNTTLTVGETLTVAYQFEAVNYSAANFGVRVRMPTTLALFPNASGGHLQLYGAPTWTTVRGSNWSNLSAGSTRHVITSTLVLSNASAAVLSTQKIAVMATTGFGTLELSFRWTWWVSSATGTLLSGPYSLANGTAFHPTIFHPAPYVQLLSTSGATGIIGTNYTLTLAGATANEEFHLELEHASNGQVVDSVSRFGATTNVTPLSANITLLGSDMVLAPGKMLLHLHNHCAAMLYSVPITVAYAPAATVRVQVSPTSCGSLDLNHTAYASGARVHLVPSGSRIPLSIGNCIGQTFSHWNSTGAVDVASDNATKTSVQIAYNGTLTAVYT